ncbi:hypothetical protein [Methylibium sp.]|uniref:hypothetical protein n=1 Tax=Methylibium sp. TaxID=2067992 RepID=UPI003D0DCF98
MNKTIQTLIVSAALLVAGAASAGTTAVTAGVAAQAATVEQAQARTAGTTEESLDFAALPEPGTYVQLLAAFLVMGLVVSRRSRRN